MKHLGLIALLAALASSTALVAAQDTAKAYPDRTIRMLVPNAPGSAVDTISRILGAKMGEILGQQLVIDNRAGAGGVIGMEIAKAANPDGYTLITASTAASTVAVQLMKHPTFDPIRDYDHLAQFAETPNVLVVHPSVPAKSVRELMDFCKAKGGQVNMASAGPGSQSHLSGTYLQQMGKFQALHIPYKGGGPSVAAVIAGESQWTLTPGPAVMTHVIAGRVRAIGHSLPKRTPLLPNIPAIAETIPGFDYSGWQGFLVPKGTPKAITDKLRDALVKTMNSPDVKKALEIQATETVIRGPEAFRKVIQETLVQNAIVIKAVGLKVE